MAKKKVVKKVAKKIIKKSIKKVAKKNVKKSTAKKISSDNDAIILVDRNYLAERSQGLIAAMTHNQLADPDMKNGSSLSTILLCKGANEMILEILEKFDSK